METLGPHFWCMIHSIALNINGANKMCGKHLRAFFESLEFLIPCSKCKFHYKLNLQLSPLTDDIISSKIKTTFWTIDIHNSVNIQNGKKQLSYEDAFVEILLYPLMSHEPVMELLDENYDHSAVIKRHMDKNYKTLDLETVLNTETEKYNKTKEHNDRLESIRRGDNISDEKSKKEFLDKIREMEEKKIEQENEFNKNTYGMEHYIAEKQYNIDLNLFIKKIVDKCETLDNDKKQVLLDGMEYIINMLTK